MASRLHSIWNSNNTVQMAPGEDAEAGGTKMRDKPGYARLTIYVPRQHYDRLVRRKLLSGQSISQSVEEALERDEGGEG